MDLNYNIASPPLYFVRSGVVDLLLGSLQDTVGGGVYMWSDVPRQSDETRSYFLSVNATDIDVSGYSRRFFAFRGRNMASPSIRG